MDIREIIIDDQAPSNLWMKSAGKFSGDGPDPVKCRLPVM